MVRCVVLRRCEQFRLFWILENAEPEELKRRSLTGPAIAVITGLRKARMTTFREADYRAAWQHRRRLPGDHPRRIAE